MTVVTSLCLVLNPYPTMKEQCFPTQIYFCSVMLQGRDHNLFGNTVYVAFHFGVPNER